MPEALGPHFSAKVSITWIHLEAVLHFQMVGCCYMSDVILPSCFFDSEMYSALPYNATNIYEIYKMKLNKVIFSLRGPKTSPF